MNCIYRGEEFYSAIDFVREYKCLQERTESMERLKIWKDQIAPWDRSAAQEARARWDSIAKPLDGLGDLEKIIADIAGMQGSADVELSPAALYVFCADNGIVNEGVTQTDASVTAAVARSMVKGQSAVCLMARRAGVEVCPVDVGMIEDVDGIRTCKVRKGTSDFLVEPSMSRSETVQTMQFGYDLAAEAARRGIRLLAAGEMGIGNTTTGAAIASVLLGLPPEKVTGRGAGLDSEGLRRKIAVIRRAIAVNHPDKSRPVELLSKLGGYDIAGMVGLYLGGALYKVPVVIDGFISAVAAALACEICPAVRDYMLCSHVSKEPAGQWMLDYLGLRPLITAELCLGEGTGGVLLLPLLDAALAVYHSSHTFDNLPMERYVEWE